MKRIILLLLIILNLQLATVFAQQNKIDSLKQVVTLAKQDTNQVKVLNKLAIKYQRINLDTSLIYAIQSLELASQLNYKSGIAKAYRNIGLVYAYRSDFKETLEYWEKALEINKEIGDKSEIATNIGNIGIVYSNQGNYSKAITYYEKALKINKEIGNKLRVAKNLGNLGLDYSNQSNYLKAMEYYEKSLKITKEIGDKSSIARILTNIGDIYISKKNNYPKAIVYHEKALKINKEIGDKSGMAINLSSIGIVYLNQSNYPKALEYYQKALKIDEEIGNKSGKATDFGNIGNIYAHQKKYSKAIEYYQKSLRIKEKIGDKYGIAITLMNIGNIYKEQDIYSKALEYYQKSLKINKEIGNKLEVAIFYENIGNLYNRKKEYIKAIDYANKALKIYKEIGIVNVNTYQNLSTSYWALKNKGKTAHNLDTVLNINNKNILLNFSILSEKAKQLYFAGLETDYWKYNSFVLQNTDSFPNMVKTVYNNTVKNKGLLLKSNTAMRNAIYSSNDSTLIEEYNNWIVLKRQIAKKYSNGGEATILEYKADSLEGHLVKKSNEFSDFQKIQNISWQQVQAGLKENEVAIEFIHFPLMNPDSSYIEFTNQTQYVALILSKNSNQPKMIPLFEEKQLEKIIGKFGGNNYSYINSIYGKNTEVNQKLYNLIWEPMEINLKGAKKVYLSPSGLLHKISFSAIAKEQNVYLCDAYQIEVKSSTGKIVEQKNRSQEMNTATLFGGIIYDTDSTIQKVWSYLEGTKTETQKIDKILKQGKIKVDYYSNTSATEEEFKLMASNSNILHIATHGFFYPDPKEIQEETEKNVEVGEITFRGSDRGFGVNSFVENNNPLMRSGLVFAGANDVWSKQAKNDSIDDGVLTAQEVSNIDMRKTELVVMSACETGLGDIKGSEGVYGLQRAFKMAGVDFMIMSLWQVPDKETEEFMTSFYKKLIKQKDIKKAFAETQKEMRGKYDPYFWAAFVLIE